MKRPGTRTIFIAGSIILGVLASTQVAKRRPPLSEQSATPNVIQIDHPAEATILPPHLWPAPTWLWRDPSKQVVSWRIEITFSDGYPAIVVDSEGERMRLGESDPHAVAPTNQPPALTPEQAAAHSWTPDDATWANIQQHSVNRPATVTITGRLADGSQRIVSRGQGSILTSSDPVGAPIFYRDVPLMPSENEKGVIKPLAPEALSLITWRLRNVSEKQSRVVMQGLHTCGNCHSFSRDGQALGMDMDGPGNDKGLYAIVKVQPKMSIRSDDLVAWSTFRGKLGSKLRVGFMSQISPDARYVVTTINDPGIDQTDYQRRKHPIDLVRNYYVANFNDYRFLQVFYPTRGVLAWYSRKTGQLNYLPGADDARYVHTNAVWSPDGKYLVFARAAARDAYPTGAPTAKYANDPNETQIQFDLYRIAFNDGKGGAPEPILGASHNGMSNSFPKVSPDGRWIVFVQSRNGLLMRPDSQLFIVPASGGAARRMNCNTARMNSWHSFSPNGRWMVFTSKSLTPYTQLFLTHIDESGNDSPAVLIDNSTAANRAANIPEFVNIPYDGMEQIEAPAAESAMHMDVAAESMKRREFEVAVKEWTRALELSPKEPRAHNSKGVALMELGRVEEAIAQYREALALNPQYPEAHNNLGEALAGKGALKEAVAQFENALKVDPEYAVAHANLGVTLARSGLAEQAIAHLKKVVELNPDAAEARRNLGHALADQGDFEQARVQLEESSRLSGGKEPLTLHLLGRVYADLGRSSEAIQTERLALASAAEQGNARLIQAIGAHLEQLTRVSSPLEPLGSRESR
ncbi:MAG: tetratricopeptide repeat protein [Myxococcales bacterium]